MSARIFAVALFDFDGVIVDSAEIKVRGFVDCFPAEPPEVQEAIRQYTSLHGGVSRFAKFRHIYDTILREALPSETLDELCLRYSRLVVEQVRRAPFVPGARELITAIHRSTECHVVSGTPEIELRQLVVDRGISHMFRNVVGSPTPKTRLTADIVGQCPHPEDVVFLGDSITDYDAARHAGIAFLGVRAAGQSAELPPDAEVTDNLLTYRGRFAP